MCLSSSYRSLQFWFEFVILGQVVALAKSRMNDLTSFERTIEQTSETMPLANNSYYTKTTKTITSLRELLHFLISVINVARTCLVRNQVERNSCTLYCLQCCSMCPVFKPLLMYWYQFFTCITTGCRLYRAQDRSLLLFFCQQNSR